MSAVLDIIVVGGGISGFTAAIALSRAGHNVRVSDKCQASHYGESLNLMIASRAIHFQARSRIYGHPRSKCNSGVDFFRYVIRIE